MLLLIIPALRLFIVPVAQERIAWTPAAPAHQEPGHIPPPPDGAYDDAGDVAFANRLRELSVVRKEGTLKKSDPRGKHWKTRWFVLEGASLRYYAKRGSSRPKGTIILAGAKVSGGDEGGRTHGRAPTPFLFQIHTAGSVGGRTYNLCAASEVDMVEWFEAVVAHIPAPEFGRHGAPSDGGEGL